ncbi:post-GPI attachment to proteins factor 6-like [Antedon mediterranea]|uniref:post-GPI attachment to proteins factor 6-like n=1 Tax=Antedon mediterranea TaxID=105859 RepID=UPI003AF9ABAE
MSSIIWHFGVLLLLIPTEFCLCSPSSAYTLMYQESKKLRTYSNYHNIGLFHFPVQSEVNIMCMVFTQLVSDVKNCDAIDLTVEIHQGSFPVVNPDGSSFPDNTYLRPSEVDQQSMKSNMTLVFDNPTPGYWFLGAYIKSDGNDRIKQEGLGKDCEYGIEVQMLSILEADITTLIDSALVEDSLDAARNATMFRYFVAPTIGSIKFMVSGCHVKHQDGKIDEACPLNITTRANALPMNVGSVYCNSSAVKDDGECQIDVQYPETKVWYYLLVEVSQQIPVNQTVIFNITLQATVCQNNKYYTNYEADGYSASRTDVKMFKDIMDLYLYNVQYEVSSSDDLDTGGMQCPEVIQLESHDLSSIFNIAFYGTTGNGTNLYQFSFEKPLITSLEVRPFIDIGGTLKIYAGIFDTEMNSTDALSIKLCLHRNTLPPITDDGEIDCPSENILYLNNTDLEDTWFVPFPESGTWYISASAQCDDDDDEMDCEGDIFLILDIHLIPCINDCGEYGTCHVGYDAGLSYAYCTCKNDYRGWGCTDDSEAWSRTYFLVQVLLLTLSNLFFIPSIILAIYRRFFPEAVVYFCTMFFSTFYHACDAGNFCIMDYNTHQYCDFYASFMAIFCTLLCMAKLPDSLKQTFTMLAVFGITVGVNYNRFSLWAALVPTVTGLVIVIVSWSYQCRRLKACYPSKKLWLTRLLPGLCLAGIGFLLYALLEKEDNYQYIHSIWHAFMAVGILFLLPTQTKKNDEHEFHMAELMDISTIHAELVENESPDY